MTFEGYFTEHDDVLENKLGITNPDELKQLESTIVALRTSEILQRPPKGRMDYAYLKKLHKKLFSDIYAFAGETRTVDIVKGDSTFCYIQFLEEEQRKIFSKVTYDFKPHISHDEFVEKLVHLSADLNALHPFREGNGRTIRLFLVLLANRCHFDLDFNAVKAEEMIEADILAFRGNLNPLHELYQRIVC